jgi:hypothetical protein
MVHNNVQYKAHRGGPPCCRVQILLIMDPSSLARCVVAKKVAADIHARRRTRVCAASRRKLRWVAVAAVLKKRVHVQILFRIICTTRVEFCSRSIKKATSNAKKKYWRGHHLIMAVDAAPGVNNGSFEAGRWSQKPRSPT